MSTSKEINIPEVRRKPGKLKTLAVTAATLTGVNMVTHGAVVDAAQKVGEGVVGIGKEVLPGDLKKGEVLAETDAQFKLVPYQLSTDKFDYEFERARTSADDIDNSNLVDVAELREQGYDFDHITNVQMIMGDEFEGPQNEFQRKRALKTAEMLAKMFPNFAVPPTYWNFEQGLYGATYGLWLKGTVANPQTGQTMEVNFSPNFARPLAPTK